MAGKQTKLFVGVGAGLLKLPAMAIGTSGCWD